MILLSDKSRFYKFVNDAKLLSIVDKPHETTAKSVTFDQSCPYKIIFDAFSGTEIYNFVMCYETSGFISITGVTCVDVNYKNINETKLFKFISDYFSSIYI